MRGRSVLAGLRARHRRTRTGFVTALVAVGIGLVLFYVGYAWPGIVLLVAGGVVAGALLPSGRTGSSGVASDPD